jgi:hypothetical protein
MPWISTLNSRKETRMKVTQLTEGQRSLLTESLRLAMEQFNHDAHDATEAGTPRIATAFDQQYNDARALMQRIENCESISITEAA